MRHYAPPASLLLVTTLGLCSTAFAQQTPPSTQAPASTPQTSGGQPPKGSDQPSGDENSIVGRIRKIKGVDPDLLNQAADLINEVLEQTRKNQDAIYKYVRQVDRNLDEVDKKRCANDQTCKDFVASTRAINSRLMVASYDDAIEQNGNLSNQIATRLPNLIEDSLRLVSDASQPRRNAFLDELTLISDRYLNSRRFRAGFGISNGFLPRIAYRGQALVDFSSFTTANLGGADHFIADADFSNNSFTSLLLSAKVPYVQIDAVFPTFKLPQTSTSGVVLRDLDASPGFLARSTITSTLSVDYEVSVKASVHDLIRRAQLSDRAQKRKSEKSKDKGPRLEEDVALPNKDGQATITNVLRKDRANATFTPVERGVRQPNSHADWGVGLGMTSFRIANSAVTDVRMRVDDNSIFTNLPTAATLTTEGSNSYSTLYGLLYATFKISDEFEVGIDVRSYRDDTVNSAQVNVDKLGFTVGVVWYPTFAFKKKGT